MLLVGLFCASLSTILEFYLNTLSGELVFNDDRADIVENKYLRPSSPWTNPSTLARFLGRPSDASQKPQIIQTSLFSHF